jgi:hypothetical protein
MKLHKSFSLSILLLCSVAMAATGVSTQESSMGLSTLREATAQTTPDKLFYVADDFGEMRVLPSYSFGAPTGIVPGWGVAFAGIAGITESGLVSHQQEDGGVSAGVGWGDPINFVGGAVVIGMGSIDPRDGGAFDRGNLNVSLGHTFTDYGLGVAVGVANVDLWHNSGDMRVDQSIYGVVTKLLPNDIAPVVISAGLGDNGFVEIDRSLTEEERRDKVGPFVSAAAYVLPQVSLVLDYTSGVTTFGTSIVPFPDYPIILGLAAYDLAKERPSDDISFLGTLVAGFSFK